MKKVLIINEGNSENLGDQLINFCIQDFFKEYDLSFQSFSCYNAVNREGVAPIQNANPSKVKGIIKKLVPSKVKLNLNRLKWVFENRNVFKSYKNQDFDLVIIGGGQLLNYFWIFPLALYKWTNIFKKSKIVIFACGSVNIREFSFLDRYFLKTGLKKCSELTFRDTTSIETVKKELKLNSSLLQDPVFRVSEIIQRNNKLNQAIILPFSFQDVYVNFNPNKMNNEQFNEFWFEKIKTESLKYDKVIVSVTDIFQDLKIYTDLQKYNFPKNVEFRLPQNFYDLIYLISDSLFVYSGRMHALIVGYSYNCKCEVFPVSKKLEIFNDEILYNNSSNIYEIKDKILRKVDGLKSSYLSL